HVTAKDLGTGKEQKMTVTGGSALPKDDIDRMMRDAEAHAEEDQRRREAAETRNQAEQLVYQTEKLLADNADKIPGDVKAETESALADVKEKLKGEDTTAIRSALEKAAAASQKIGSALYSQTPGAASGTDSAPGGGPVNDEEEVVDAEIVDDERTEGGAR
ncbi:Hsp70 family protein, partial [Streptomyces sp. A475]|uniref:Hsp70 family protein n=1 Tax=Streptomyces sp. A475 TaxID=3131976 RepID=UPI0030C98E15